MYLGAHVGEQSGLAEKCYQGMCQCFTNICGNVLPDKTNIMDMIITGISITLPVSSCSVMYQNTCHWSYNNNNIEYMYGAHKLCCWRMVLISLCGPRKNLMVHLSNIM